MTTAITRIVLILPLIWALSLSLALASPKAPKKKGKKNPPVTQQLDWGAPVAEIGTPEKSIQIYRLTPHEHPEWTYMVVMLDEDGSHLSYGEENTVGLLMETLRDDLKLAAGTAGRCPSAAGWRFESKSLRVSYCNENQDTRRIERAVGLLETTRGIVRAD
ncbi:MAG: hypothetical protein HY074_13750 [Deltaproteobacteria bacterium]|nr:hypothetical protein [Deltaproteobacteria bacterium]